MLSFFIVVIGVPLFIYFIIDYALPKLYHAYTKMKLQATVESLPDRYVVLKDIHTAEYDLRTNSMTGEARTMNYVIVSNEGIMAICMLDIKHYYSWVHGSEQDDYWLYHKFGRLFLPFVGGLGDTKREVVNPIKYAREFLMMLQKELNLDSNIPLHPIAVIVPKTKGIDIQDREDTSRVVFPGSLIEVIKKFDGGGVSDEQVSDLRKRIIANSRKH